MRAAVCIVTYNQEKYIAHAIESVLAQKTNFGVDIIIGDDASTDKTTDICNEYAAKYNNLDVFCFFNNKNLHNNDEILKRERERGEIIVLNDGKNKRTVGNTINVFRYIFTNAESKGYKYIAMLDGDDYWIDEHKLQKQIDFLEQNPDYALIHTNCATLNQKSGKISYPTRKKDDVPSGNILSKIRYVGIANCTVVHRLSVLKNIDLAFILSLELLSCDYITNAIIASVSKVAFLEDTTAVWRKNIDSVSSSKNVEKQMKYIEHEVKQAVALAKLFPNEEIFSFSIEEQNLFRAYRSMEIAYGLKNYDLAHKTALSKILPKTDKHVYWARNRFLFYIYPICRKIVTFFNKIFK